MLPIEALYRTLVANGGIRWSEFIAALGNELLS